MINERYDEVFTFDKIYKAHLRGRLSKRDRKTLVKFEMIMLENLWLLYECLKSRRFSIKNYNSFTVYEPKRREIQTLEYKDRIIQHIICDDVLAPYFTKRAILDNCVCQKGKGMHFALDRFEKRLKDFARVNKANGWVLKCDIKKYFPSIPHDNLKSLICEHIKDKEISKLVAEIIDSYYTDISYLKKYNLKQANGYTEEKTGRGIPIGNQTSQIFGMFYLDKLDRYIKEKLRIKIYSRYMDDFVLVHKDKKIVEQALCEIKKITAELGLDLNEKTQIFPLKNGVQYLGFRYFVNKNGKVVKQVVKKTVRRLKRRVKLLKRAYCDGSITKERIRMSLVAFHGHLSHGNCFKLEQKIKYELKEYI